MSERQGRAHMGFSKRIDTIFNWKNKINWTEPKELVQPEWSGDGHNRNSADQLIFSHTCKPLTLWNAFVNVWLHTPGDPQCLSTTTATNSVKAVVYMMQQQMLSSLH